MTTEENNKKTQSEKPTKKWYENTKKIIFQCFSSGKFLILLIILLIIAICYPYFNKLLDLLLSHLRSSFIIVLILFIIINLIFFLKKKLKKRTNKIEKNKNTIFSIVNALKSSDSCKQFISYFIKTTRYFLSFIFNFFILASLTIIFLDSLMKKELSFNHADKPFYVMFFTYVTMAIFVYNHFFSEKIRDKYVNITIKNPDTKLKKLIQNSIPKTLGIALCIMLFWMTLICISKVYLFFFLFTISFYVSSLYYMYVLSDVISTLKAKKAVILSSLISVFTTLISFQYWDRIRQLFNWVATFLHFK
ncbi:hypothetical protein ACTL31_05040 [Leuconostoc mesenteroides]